MEFVTYKESMDALYASLESSNFYEKLFLDDALDHTLAEDIVADHNSPAFPTASMDGYAIKHEDMQLGRLRIRGINPAGSFSDEELMGGEAVKTFTGSLMPKGSDTLIPIENVEVEGDEIVIKEEVPFGFSVRPVGENYKEGETLIHKNSKIGFAEIGVLASLNIPQVLVYKRARVSILATGSEVLDVGERQSNPAQIRSSNQFTLYALAKKCKADTIRLPLQKDDKESLRTSILSALDHSDIVVTTGGVSVGDFDFVKDILSDLEAEYITKGVILKPGQHIKIVKVGKKYIFALPGFPYSSTVTFILYVLPVIRYLNGLDPKLPLKRAVLKKGYKKRTQKTEIVTANIHYEDGEFQLDFDGKKSGSSAILTNMLGSVALMIVPQKSGDLEAGESVEFIDLNEVFA